MDPKGVTQGKLDAHAPQPLAPTTAPHDVYLSSEEDASSSADDFSDYDLDSEEEHTGESPLSTVEEHLSARAVSIVFYGKPSLVTMPARASKTNTNSSTSTASTLRPFPNATRSLSRPTTVVAPSYSVPVVPSFLGTDPCNPQQQPQQQQQDQTKSVSSSRSAGAMFKRTLTLATKMHARPSSPAPAAMARNTAFMQSSESLPPRPGTAHSDMRAPVMRDMSPSVQSSFGRRSSTFDSRPPVTRGNNKGHSRLRSSLSISMSRKR